MPARLFVKIPVPVIMHIPPPQIFFSYTRSLVNGNRGWNFFKDAHDRKILLSRAEHYALEPGYKKKNSDSRFRQASLWAFGWYII